MKRLLILSLTMLLGLALFAQKDVINPNLTPINKKDLAYAKKIMKRSVVHFGTTKDLHYLDIVGTPIGKTNYDLQTNSAVAHRFLNFGDGRYSAVWTDYDGTNLPSAPERGTGYAFYDGSSWQYTDLGSNNQHIEGGVARTGWAAMLTDGTKEFVVNHYRSAGGLYLWDQAIGASGSGWTQGSIEGYTEAQLWPRAAYGQDEDGNYIFYVISVDDFGTNEFPQAVYFAKSTDGGQTWQTVELPGFSDKYAYANGDQYAIAARDSIVAIAYFASYGDLTVWKSTDYGDTWTTMVVNDFPVDQFDMDATALDMDNNGTADTLETTDNTGDIAITPDGKVHVVFSVMRNLDETQGDNYAYSYFPYTDGLLYWNEDMGEGQYNGLDHQNYVGLNVPDSVQLIAYSFDLNGNNIIWEFADAGGGFPFGTYYTAITSFSNMAVDDSGNVYVVFTTVMEGDDFVKSDAQPNAQSYRHGWVMVRYAGDSTNYTSSSLWSDPYCFTTADANAAENVFPTVPRQIDTLLPVWVQWDNEPGLNIRGDNDNATDNYIVAKFIPVRLLGVNVPGGGDTTFVGSHLDVNVYPNPTDGIVRLTNVKNSQVSVYNTLGQLINSFYVNEENYQIDLTSLPAGTYIINVANSKGSASYKVVKK